MEILYKRYNTHESIQINGPLYHKNAKKCRFKIAAARYGNKANDIGHVFPHHAPDMLSIKIVLIKRRDVNMSEKY